MAASLLYGRAAAKEAAWESHGPYGGVVLSVTVSESNPDCLLVYTPGGNFLSHDRGSSWKRVPVPARDHVQSKVYLLGERFFYAHGDTLFCSNDALSWTEEVKLREYLKGEKFQAGDLADTLGVAGLTCKPKRPSDLWCVLLVQRETAKYDLFVAMKEEGKWKSVKLSKKPQNYAVHRPIGILFCQTKPSFARVFVGRNFAKTDIFTTDDGGKSWARRTVDAVINYAVLLPDKPDSILALGLEIKGAMSGLLCSRDGGKTWEQICPDPRAQSLHTFLLTPEDGCIYLGSRFEGLFKTTDGGKTIFEVGKELLGKGIRSIAACIANRDVLYVGTTDGLYRTTTGGKDWKKVTQGISGCQITALVAFEQEPERLLAFDYTAGVRVSTDGGRSWLAALPPDQAIPGVVFPCTWGDTILAGGTRKNKPVVVLSRDRGNTWSRVESLTEKDHPLLLESDGTMYVVRDSQELWKSSDAKSWKKFGGPFESLGDDRPGSRAIWKLCRPPGKEYFWAIGMNAVVRCCATTGKDLGKVDIPAGILPSPFFFFPLSDPDFVLLGSLDGGVYLGDLKSNSWKKVYTHQSLYGRTYPVGIAVDPSDPARLFVGYSEGHIAVSADAGRSWTAFSPQLGLFDTRAIAVTADRKLVVAGVGPVHVIELAREK